ncbi:hypothetical protein [Planococcus halotolerans]|uniref:hypothetical protein n=1 Tax=Planococcus halotolerans TaxID=2233542 RepID=UPI0030840F84
MKKSKEVETYIDDCDILSAIGLNEIRERFQLLLESKMTTIPVLIHPTAIISEEVIIDLVTVIIAGAIITPSVI